MPKRLLERYASESIKEFQAAANERFKDADSLVVQGRRTAAIYLWGYTAEMLLKVAYFRLIGTPSTSRLTIADLGKAKADAKALGLIWSGNFHNLMSWANLIVKKRSSNPVWNYPTVGFANQLVTRVQLLEELWEETLRYHKNVAYLQEVGQVKASVGWLVSHSESL